MLDSYIIDRIRKEREQRERSSQVPLRIEREPIPHVPPTRAERAPEDKRGSVVIDFQL